MANCDGVIRTYSQTYSEEGLAQSKLWPKGTLCITIAANIGKTGILAFDACFPDSVVGLVAGDRVTIEYVREWFVGIQKNLDQSAPQVAQKNINLAILNALQIPVPPKNLQERFTRIVGEVREAQSHALAVRQNTDGLFDSLVQRAFRGEL
ncbi:MAG: restriction endonuclease subunit S [Phycisphaerales bacterium]|nr:restriction endonuclease subunit S [Phycisphaerales bacterium]